MCKSGTQEGRHAAGKHRVKPLEAKLTNQQSWTIKIMQFTQGKCDFALTMLRFVVGRYCVTLRT